MFAQKLLPAFAVLGLVAAQTASICSQSTATINSQADATQYASCSTISGSVLIGPDASGTVDLSGPQQITGDLVISNAGQLTSFTSSSIGAIGGTFKMFNLTLLSTLSFTDLQQVGIIYWDSLPALSQLTFPAFVSQAKQVTITNTFLSTLDGINLMTVGLLDINNNNRLKTFSTQVTNITQSINIASNGRLLDISFPNLIWANNMTFRNVSTVSIPSLASVNGSLIFDENYFTSLSAPNLTSVGSTASKEGSLAFVANPQLTNITIPGLLTCGGGVQVANNTDLQTISFPALTTVGGAIDLAGNFTTPNLPALVNVVGALNIQSTQVIQCDGFNKLSGNVVQGKESCVSATNDPSTLSASGSGTASGSSSKPTSSKGAAISYGVNEAVAGLSVMGGLLQMLL
jgi:hypothetical protein